ncbi:MAG TPA: S8 family serine peptidase [Usitatibacter sp.]|nr:S8 family serine peptidase [Usitatibacter sp.]
MIPVFPSIRDIHRFIVAAIAATLAIAAAPALAQGASDGTVAAKPTQDTSSAIVQLNGDPLSTYSKTRPARGRKIDFNGNTVKAYRAQLAALRIDYKSWLRANVPQAKVTGEFDISLNAVAVQLNGATLAQVSAAPQVKTAQYEGLYYPIGGATDPDLALINAVDAWNAVGGPANAGEGVKVAIVDTGIDITHPCFSDAGYPAQAKLGDRTLTNNKVIAAKVFNNKTPSRGFTAAAIQSHGTHVAGTVACNAGTPATVDGVVIPYAISGVAPRALLGNYNVFPGNVENARSEDILNALEAAYADGFDVANMSLGGGAHGIQDLLTIAVDDLDAANMVVAVAAGNSGPGLFTVESPGSAARALSAGASSVPHFVGTPVSANGATYGAASGEFATVATDLTATLAAVAGGSAIGLDTACSSLAGLSGKIALLSRGSCTFSTKVRNAQSAGAVAVVMVNNVPGDPIAMAQDGTANQPTIPAYMVALDDGTSLKGANGAAATIGATQQYFLTTRANIMADFSSQGPTDVDFRVKPDVVAPGVNVLSSLPANACAAPPCFAFFSGTSMATPHLAGSAAFLRGEHPDWSAAQVRSAVVNTATRGVLRNFADPSVIETNVNVIGTGRDDLAAAGAASVALDPVSVSFGAVPSGSGQARTFDVTLTNVGGSAATWTLAVKDNAPDASVAYSVAPSSVSLAPGASTTVTVTMVAARGASVGGHQAELDVNAGTTNVAHAVLYTLVK